MSRSLPLLFSLALLSGCQGADTQPSAPPSIVFISIDTLSARHMSLYGYERDTTPALNELAASSIVFERCWANAPWTTPSYMSQFTGLLAPSLFDPTRGDTAWALAEEHTTLAEELSVAGYQTAAFVDNLNLAKRHGLDQGFGVFDMTAARMEPGVTGGGIAHVSSLGLSWLDQRTSDRPFLLFLQAIDVHGPYVSAGDHAGAFNTSASSLENSTVPVAETADQTPGAIPQYIAKPFLTQAQTSLETEPIVTAYDEGIRAIDAALDTLLQELEQRGVLDESILVISADHGESMVDHDSYFSHCMLHGNELHVPLLVRLPGGSEPRRVQTPVQLVDLFPTLLQLSDVAVAPSLPGRSLVPALAGDEFGERPAFAFGDFQSARSIALGKWKLIETTPNLDNSGLLGFLNAPRARKWLAEKYPQLDGRVLGTLETPLAAFEGAPLDKIYAKSIEALGGPFFALFNLEEDARERNDVSSENPAVVAELLELLNQATESAAASYIQGGELGSMSEEEREALLNIGYLGE